VEEDLLPQQLEGVSVHYVTTIEEVLQVALPQSPQDRRVDAETREQVISGVPVV
jgi:ATP-dependent Lon protease